MDVMRLEEMERGMCAACPRCASRAGLFIHSVPLPLPASRGIAAWVQCECGFTPFREIDRIETPDGLDVWLVALAITEWNYKVAAAVRRAKRARKKRS